MGLRWTLMVPEGNRTEHMNESLGGFIWSELLLYQTMNSSTQFSYLSILSIVFVLFSVYSVCKKLQKIILIPFFSDFRSY